MAIKLADAFIEVLLDYAKAEKDAANMDKTIGGLTSGTITKLSAGMTAAGAAITGTLGVAASKAAEFGENLANVSTLGVKDIGALDEGTRDLAVKFGIDLNDAMKATYETISAGIPEDAAIMVMEQAARGAQAGVGSLGDALDLGTSVLNAWNIKGKDAAGTAAEMEKIMGMAATAAFKGKTTFAEMATSIGQVAPVASAAGFGVDEFFAAVAALTATGKPTSSAMLNLQQAVSNIIKPSKEAQEMAQSLGLEFDAQALKSKGLAGFLDSVKTATGGNVEQMGILFGSVEALGTVISLTGNQADVFKDALQEMGKAQDNLSTMQAAFIANNPALAFKQLKAEMQNLFILIGRSVMPVLQAVVPVLKDILGFVAQFMENHPTIAAFIGTTIGLLGGLLLALGGIGLTIAAITPAIAALSGVGGFAGLATAVTGAGTAAAAAAGATGIGALGASLGAVSLALLPIVGLLGVIAATFVYTAPTIASTAKAYWDLAASNKAVYDQGAAYIELLQRQGIALDADALKHMSYANQQATINNAVIAYREQSAAREIELLTGTEATRQQIHIAEMARVGLEISAKEAAALAVQGTTQQEILAMMAKGATEQAITQQSMALGAQARAASSEQELEGRTDRTATIGVFQWAADKEAAMLAKAKELKSADYQHRRMIMSDLARMEADKAAAERQWAMENQALTSGEIAGMQYKVQAKEAADAKYIAIAEGTMKAEKDQLYVNLSDQMASITVHGDASVRKKAWEAEERKKLSEKLAKVEGDVEDKIGKKKLDALNESLKKIQEQSDFEKLNTEQLAAFKEQMLKGDLDKSLQYWSQLRDQSNAGYITSKQQFMAYSAEMQAEAAKLRQALAYAMNPNQTGSPSLNMEIAAGFVQTQNLVAANLNGLLTNMASFRQSSVALLSGLGAILVGGSTASPGPSDVAKPTGPTPLNGTGNTQSGGGPMSISAPISITITGGLPTEAEATSIGKKMGDGAISQIAHGLAQHTKRHARGRGTRGPGLTRTASIPL